MKKVTIFKNIFFLISIIHIISIIVNNEGVRVFTKPLMLFLLVLFYISSVEVVNKAFLIALSFSLLGDVFLISNSEMNFMFGLASFLTAHILYIIVVFKQLKESVLRDKIKAATPFVFVLFGLIYLLINNLGEMLIPVIVYGLVISIFGTVSLLNYLIEKSKKSLLLFIGSLFFILSDSILAINKFHEPKLFYPVLIMTTYIVAQYLICRFMIVKKEE